MITGTPESLTLDALARRIAARAGGQRLIVALAGPPGAGKSTAAAGLVERLGAGAAGRAALVAMDGYHLDNALLAARGLKARKGAPETFDVAALAAALARIAAGLDTPVPVFDRAADFSRAAAAMVPAAAQFVLVEGNYLLLGEEPWSGLAPLFGLRVFLSAGETELERRLVRRWRDLGADEPAARARAQGNDMANVRLTLSRSLPPDLHVRILAH